MNLSFQQLLEYLVCEGVMDLETTQASRLVIKALKRYFEEAQLKKKHPIFPFGKGIKQKDSQFYTNIHVWSETAQAEITVAIFLEPRDIDIVTFDSGDASPKGINIRISIPEDISLLVPAILGKAQFIWELKSFLRHEFEHYRQLQRSGAIIKGKVNKKFSGPEFYQPAYAATTNLRNTTEPAEINNVWSDYSAAINYFLDPTEVEAFVMQLYRVAKMKKQPLDRVLKSYVQLHLRSLFAQNMEKQQAKDLADSIQSVWMDYANKRLPHLGLKSPFAV